MNGVWIDAQGTQLQGAAERGIGRHVFEIVAALERVAPGVLGSVRLDPKKPVPGPFDSLTGGQRLGWGVDRPADPSEVPPIYHVPAAFEPFPIEMIWPAWIRNGPVKTVVTLHDLVPLVMAETYLHGNPAFRALYTARLGLIREADQVLAISDSTAADAVEHLGVSEQRITLIESGVSDTFSSLVSSPEAARSRLAASFPAVRDGFMLYVGGGDPRKNMRRTVEAYGLVPPELRREHQLVVACRLGPHETAELNAYARTLGVAEDELLLVGYVSDPDLAAMYKLTELFIFPSLYEGFGLPILEAMSCGAPVGASNNSSIPEVLGDLEATFDAEDPASIAETVGGLLRNPERIEPLRERSRRRVEYFTWDKTASKVVEGYEAALAAPSMRPASRRRRPRVAVVTPWAPERSRSASVSRRLVAPLSQHADLDVVVPGGHWPSRGGDGPGVRFFSLDSLEWLRKLRTYDRIVYSLDDSPAHEQILRALMEQPGLVLFHDVRVIALYRALQQGWFREEPDWLMEKLITAYGVEAPFGGLKAIKPLDAYLARGIYLTQEIQQTAETMVVHSSYQRGILERERPEGAAKVEVLPAPVAMAPARAGDGWSAGGPIVFSGGALDPARKRLELLVAGFASFAASRPGARLVLAGQATRRQHAEVTALATQLGVAEKVTILGWAEEGEYWRLLGSADLVVQLRQGADAGTVSGSACDAIAGGKPLIVSHGGWFADLPAAAAARAAADCSPAGLAALMEELIDDPRIEADMQAAQRRLAEEASYTATADRLAELLSL